MEEPRLYEKGNLCYCNDSSSEVFKANYELSAELAVTMTIH